MSNTLSVIIPAYNEENGIADIIERVLSIKKPLAEVGVSDLELIVVDDASQDRTAEIVASYPEVVLIRHTVNRNYGAAIKTGFRQAKGNLLAFLDADGTYPPEAYPRLCQPILEDEADLVIGSRMAGADSEMPLVRRIGNAIFATLVSIISNRRVTDSASGQRVLRSDVLSLLYPLPDGLNFTPVMSTRAMHEQIKVVEVPITYSERVGRSKLSVVHDGTRFLHSIIWTALTYNPVRVLGFVGGAGILLATLIGLGTIIARGQGITTLGPWGAFVLFAAQVLAVVGVSIFTLGATFNYLVSLFHNRPIRQGLFGKPIFARGLDHHFGWLGLLAVIGGLLLLFVCMVVGVNSWPVLRLWLYMLGSAMLILVGVQLIISWVLMRVLEELSQRNVLVSNDLNGNGKI